MYACLFVTIVPPIDLRLHWSSFSPEDLKDDRDSANLTLLYQRLEKTKYLVKSFCTNHKNKNRCEYAILMIDRTEVSSPDADFNTNFESETFDLALKRTSKLVCYDIYIFFPFFFHSIAPSCCQSEQVW